MNSFDDDRKDTVTTSDSILSDLAENPSAATPVDAGELPATLVSPREQASEPAQGSEPTREAPRQTHHRIHDGPNFLRTPIHELRRKRGLSISALARLVRMDPAHLELIEQNSNFAAPSRAELEDIAAALGASVHELA
jgi:hypothetical protein